jgi:hypothetical protein
LRDDSPGVRLDCPSRVWECSVWIKHAALLPTPLAFANKTVVVRAQS